MRRRDDEKSAKVNFQHDEVSGSPCILDLKTISLVRSAYEHIHQDFLKPSADLFPKNKCINVQKGWRRDGI